LAQDWSKGIKFFEIKNSNIQIAYDQLDNPVCKPKAGRALSKSEFVAVELYVRPSAAQCAIWDWSETFNILQLWVEASPMKENVEMRRSRFSEDRIITVLTSQGSGSSILPAEWERQAAGAKRTRVASQGCRAGARPGRNALLLGRERMSQFETVDAFALDEMSAVRENCPGRFSELSGKLNFREWL